MNDNKDKKKAGDDSHLYNGMIAPPVNNSFWETTNVRASDQPAAGERKAQQLKSQGPEANIS